MTKGRLKIRFQNGNCVFRRPLGLLNVRGESSLQGNKFGSRSRWDQLYISPCRRLLGKSLAPFPPLAAPTPLFRPHDTKLGKQRRRPAQSQNLRHQHDEPILYLHVLALPRTMVDRRGIHIGLRLRRRLDVAASRTLIRVQNPIFNYSASSAEYHAATNYPQTKLLIPIYIEC